MGRIAKFDYDSDEFYDEVFALAMQGLTDAEIAYSVGDNINIKHSKMNDHAKITLSAPTFSCMVNGNYKGWTKAENKRRSDRLSKVLARARKKNTSIVRGAYLKAALGGKKLKNRAIRYLQYKCPCEGKDKDCPLCAGTGIAVSKEKAVVEVTEIEQAPNMQALSTWLYHHDEEWRKTERKEDNDDEIPTPDEIDHGIDIDSWIKDKIKK